MCVQAYRRCSESSGAEQQVPNAAEAAAWQAPPARTSTASKALMSHTPRGAPRVPSNLRGSGSQPSTQSCSASPPAQRDRSQAAHSPSLRQTSQPSNAEAVARTESGAGLSRLQRAMAAAGSSSTMESAALRHGEVTPQRSSSTRRQRAHDPGPFARVTNAVAALQQLTDKGSHNQLHSMRSGDRSWQDDSAGQDSSRQRAGLVLHRLRDKGARKRA